MELELEEESKGHEKEVETLTVGGRDKKEVERDTQVMKKEKEEKRTIC